MPQSTRTQTLTTQHPIRDDIAQKGYSLLRAGALHIADDLRSAWDALQASYPDLPADDFLPDGGRYRFRRYDSFRYEPQNDALTLLPHDDYFQTRDINAVTGGMVRQFAPLTPDIAANPFLHALIRFDFAQFPLSEAQQHQPWRVDVHLIRVMARAGEQGQPTPEGIHRDGAAFVTVHLAELDNADGGDVTVYDDDKRPLASFRLYDVMDAYLFADDRLWHGVTPIQPREASRPGVRSILTFDYRPDIR